MSDTAPGGTSWRDDPRWPAVDVVIPVRNEAAHLAAAIDSVRAQRYPGPLRIVLAVGPSTDGTESVAADLAASAADLDVVPNPSGATPAALNAAIRAGDAPIVVRVDGHSVLAEGYVERAVAALRTTGAANVGGRQAPEPTTAFEMAVAAATTSLLGTGGPSYRVGGEPGPVDTVYLGVFDRAAIEGVGLFDERLLRNQDYELNIRLRQAGHVVWFDPELRVGYQPRRTWSALARQYYEYGRWKAVVMRLHPGSARPRQLLAPAGITAVVLGALFAPRRRVAAAAPMAYGAAVVATAARATASWSVRIRMLGVLPTIHVAWVVGLARGWVGRPIGRTTRR